MSYPCQNRYRGLFSLKVRILKTWGLKEIYFIFKICISSLDTNQHFAKSIQKLIAYIMCLFHLDIWTFSMGHKSKYCYKILVMHYTQDFLLSTNWNFKACWLIKVTKVSMIGLGSLPNCLETVSMVCLLRFVSNLFNLEILTKSSFSGFQNWRAEWWSSHSCYQSWRAGAMDWKARRIF